MQYDGSINIDTRVDTKGMNKGTKSIAASMGNVLKSIKAVGAALGLAFSGAAVINFIKKTLESFDLMSSAVGDEIKQVKDAFEGLKGALANTVLALFVALQPYIIAAVQWLTQMLNTLTAIIAALFGVQDLTANAAENTGDMNKKAKGALASFDQINVLGNGNENAKSILPNATIPPELLAKVEDFKKKMLEFLQPVTKALIDLFEALKPLGKTIWEGLQWAWENILVPLGNWVVSDLVPAFLELLASAADVLNEALIALAPLAQEFFDNFLQPLAEWAGGKIIEFLDWLTEKLHELANWINENPEKFQDFIAIVLILAAVFKIAGLIIAAFAITVSATVLAIVALFAALGVAIYLLIAHWEELSTTVKQILFIIGYYVSQGVEFIKNAFFGALETIQNAWVTIGSWFTDNVTDPIRNTFAEMLFNIASGFIATLNGIKDYVISVVNDIIGIINNGITNITDAFNGLSNTSIGVAINSKGSDSLAPRIPRLATGAVIPPNAEFAAILGDQRSGRNLEAPEGLIRQIIREEMGSGNNTVTVQMPVYLDSEKVYDGVKKVEIRRGPSLIGGLS